MTTQTGAAADQTARGVCIICEWLECGCSGGVACEWPEVHHRPPFHLNLSPADRDALQFARALSRTDWTTDNLREIYQLHNYDPTADVDGRDRLAAAVLARASVFLGELAGIIARMTGEDV